MARVRGYVDTEQIKQAMQRWPELQKVGCSTTQIIQFVFKKALEA